MLHQVPLLVFLIPTWTLLVVGIVFVSTYASNGSGARKPGPKRKEGSGEPGQPAAAA